MIDEKTTYEAYKEDFNDDTGLNANDNIEKYLLYLNFRINEAHISWLDGIQGSLDVLAQTIKNLKQ